jgi:hypothetical protein
MVKTFEQFKYEGNKADMTNYMGYNINDYSLDKLEDAFQAPGFHKTYHEVRAFRNALEFVKERDIDYYKELIFIEMVDSEYIDDVPTIYDEDEE